MSQPYRSAHRPVDLGPAVSRHAKSGTVVGRIVLTLFLCGPAAFLGGRAIIAGVPLFDQAAPLLVSAAWFVVLIVLPLVAVVSIVNILRHRGDVIVVHEHGLVAHVAGVDAHIPHAAIRGIRSRVVRTQDGVFHDHCVEYDHDGASATLSLNGDYEKVEALIEALRQRSLESLVARARLEHDAGRAISFGPVALGPEALEVRGTRLPLAALDRLELRAGVVEVYAKGRTEPWAEQEVAELTNVHVLLSMLQR